MARACRREPLRLHVSILEEVGNEDARRSQRGPAVESDVPNVRVVAQEAREWISGRVQNCVVPAPLPAALRNDIPDGHAVRNQRRRSLTVRSLWVEREEDAHDLPEMVLRIPIVLVLREGLLARERPDDHDTPSVS